MFDRDEQDVSRIIAEGLEAILSGTSTMEEVIAAHPEQEALLRTELEAARWLVARQGEIGSRPGFVAASRKRVVARIQEEAADHNAKHAFFGMIWPQRIAYRWVAALSFIFILLSGLGGVVTVSQNSLPGDNLYQVKRVYEQVAISVAPNEAQRASLAAQFSRRRLDEARQLIDKGDYAAAESSLAEFEQGVNQAISLLQQVSDKQLNEKQDAAVALQQNLSSNADQLTQMAPTVPSQILGVVIHARDTSMNGVIAAARVIDEVNEKKSATSVPTSPPQPGGPVNNGPLIPPTLALPGVLPTSTAIPTVIYIPVKTATDAPPAPVNTAPAATAGVTLAPTVAVTPVPPTATLAPSETPTDIPTVTSTATPVAPTITPTNTPLPTDTPQPTPTDTPTSASSATPISNSGVPTFAPTLPQGTQLPIGFIGHTPTPDPLQASPAATGTP